jgi:hypothetical protein
VSLNVWRVLVGLALVGAAGATETDQYTTPPRVLFDVGPLLSQKIVSIIEADRTGAPPDRILARWVGRNVLRSYMTAWVKSVQVPGEMVMFKPSLRRSIFRTAASPAVASFVFDSPTINIHGHYVGTDKVDHLLQKGHGYFEAVRRGEAAGLSTAEAIRQAVAHGVKQEHSYFGTLASGVYSNADLAANYAGMKFYLDLAGMFVKTGTGWQLREGLDAARILEPYVTDHLDESLNPSRYRFSRGRIGREIAKRCEKWTAFYGEKAKLGTEFGKLWFGEDYGHWLPEGQEVSVWTACKVDVAKPVEMTEE